ncbi:MAG TPA: DHA2 family efflux MFS transporter permease subunit [Baekduia sp.]|nr:DHA2 family efflux MFS transporter permease subunit [Baekduia sp.]
MPPIRPLRPTVRQLASLPTPPHAPAAPRGGLPWTFAITALALFMFALDRLIVTNALPDIERDLGASVTALEWTINAFTLTFSVLLLTGAALGDRFGRRRMFTIGLGLFAAGSAAAALAPSAPALIAARALQGAGGAIIAPLSLTLLTAATPPHRRGAVLGAWGATAGIAAAGGPVVGGALTGTLSWHWIFWLNVPIGVALIPLAHAKLAESHGLHPRLDLPGLALSGAGLLALVWGLVDAGRAGWTSPAVLAALCAGTLALAGFIAWEQRAPAPMLPLAFFGARAFATAGAISALAYGGLFGALFLIGQLLQTGFGADPLRAGLGLLPMTAAMIVTAPAAGALSDRFAARRLLSAAVVLEAVALAWLALHARPGASYLELAAGLAAVGVGAAGLFAPIQAVQLGSVGAAQLGQASGAAVAIRELGGVVGVSVIAAIFTAHGTTAGPAAFLAGARPALLAAALAVAAAAVIAALALPRRADTTPLEVAEAAPARPAA